MALKKEQEKEYAKTLFLKENLTQKEIAERVGVTEKTLGKWIVDGGWEKLKKSLLVTKIVQLAMFYDQLEWINQYIASRPIKYDVPEWILKPIKLKDSDGGEYLKYQEYDEKDYPIKFGNVATPSEADVIIKITTSIKKLETELSIGQIIEVAKEFIDFTSDINLVQAKEVTKLFDVFIKAKMQ